MASELRNGVRGAFRSIDRAERGRAGNQSPGRGGRPLGHRAGESDQQGHARRGRRVERVLSETAEELLHDDDREDAADEAEPPRGSGRQVQRQDDAGDDRAVVVDGGRLTGRERPAVFGEDAERGTVDEDAYGVGPEEPDGGRDGGKEA